MMRFLAVITVLLLVDQLPGQALPDSPRLRRLQQELAERGRSAVDDFWQECAGKCPLVEAGDDPSRALVTILWRGGDNLRRIEVRGGPQEGSRRPFERLAGTDVWYHSELLPLDSRFVYGLIVTQRAGQQGDSDAADEALEQTYPLDPLNSRVFNGGPVVELREAPIDRWHDLPSGMPRGETQHVTVASAALSEERGITVYTPAAFDPAQRHAVVVLLDGEECVQLMQVPDVLDHLNASGRIPPTIAFLVDSQGTRDRDLVFSDSFVEFLADELVGEFAKRLGLRLDPKTTLIGGMSLGGLTAAYAAELRPEVFGLVLSQSGAFWRAHPDKPAEGGWLPGEIASRRSMNARYYLEVGLFESESMIENNRRMRDVLRAKGNEVAYTEYNGGHDHVNWRVSIGDGLVSLLDDLASQSDAAKGEGGK
jgi:enterochelin esterase-like enzyme